MATSKLQEETKRRLMSLFTGYRVIENHRPVWMTNDETGRPLEIDLYLPDFKIGVEIQGIQHQEFTPYFHKSIYDFYYQQKRDALKKDLCIDNSVHLYEVFNEEDIDKFIYDLRFYNDDLWKTLSSRNSEIKSLSYLTARVFSEIHVQGKDSDRIQSLLRRINNIADRYGIPTQSIKPDFTIKKIEMKYFGKPLIKVYSPEIENMQSYKSEIAAIISVSGQIAKVGFHRQKKDVVMEFDLLSGEGIDQTYWKLRLDTIPAEIISKAIDNSQAATCVDGNSGEFIPCDGLKVVEEVING